MTTSEQLQDILQEEIEAYWLFTLEEMKTIVVEGPPGLPGSKPGPAQRLLSFQRDTIPEDVLVFTDPQYLEKMHAGMVPEPVPYVWYPLMNGKHVSGPWRTPDEAIQDAMMRGLPPNPDGSAPIEPKNYFWSLLAQLPTKEIKPGSFIPFEYYAKDFKRLIEMQAERQDGQMERQMGI